MKKHGLAVYYMLGLLVLLIVGSGVLVLSRPHSPAIPPASPTTSVNSTTSNTEAVKPAFAVFMRQGTIWTKDFETGREKRISKSPKVTNPGLSTSGKFVYYFEISDEADGSPTYRMYLSDIYGEDEKKFDLYANIYASKLKWSQVHNYLGMVLFANDGSAEAMIYDADTHTEFPLGKLPHGSREGDSYLLNTNCESLLDQYQDFCNAYVVYLSKPRDNQSWDAMQMSRYTSSKYQKAKYNLSNVKNLPNGDVVLEYYAGKPTSAGINHIGGMFHPGYDDGVTETYVLLVDGKSGVIIEDIPMATSSDFSFTHIYHELPKVPSSITSTWQTFIDDTLGIAIRYPPDVVVIYAQSGSSVQFARKENATKDFRAITTLDIYDRGAPGTDPVTEFKRECGQSCTEKYKDVHINNAVGIQTLGLAFASPYNFYLSDGSKTSRTVRMFLANNEQEKNYEEFVQMITTFRFIDTSKTKPSSTVVSPISDNSVAVTEYRDSDFHFVLSYPEYLTFSPLVSKGGGFKELTYYEPYQGVISNTIHVRAYREKINPETDNTWRTTISQERIDYKQLLTIWNGEVYKPMSDVTKCTGYKANGIKGINNIEWHTFKSIKTDNDCARATVYLATTLYVTEKSGDIYALSVNPYKDVPDDKLNVIFKKIVESFSFIN